MSDADRVSEDELRLRKVNMRKFFDDTIETDIHKKLEEILNEYLERAESLIEKSGDA